MGCGGSRADTIIEPRYHESWTRETESTWLTNTDIETPLPGINSRNCGEEMSCRVENTKSAGNHKEKRMVNTGTQCGKQTLTSTTGSSHQRRSRRSCHEQMTRDSRSRVSKEVSVPSKDGIQPVSGAGVGDAAPTQSCDER